MSLSDKKNGDIQSERELSREDFGRKTRCLILLSLSQVYLGIGMLKLVKLHECNFGGEKKIRSN